MTNNKQQTEINAVEYLDKVNQFAKENNTGKPKQQTAVEWLSEQLLTQFTHGQKIQFERLFEMAKEREKEQRYIELPSDEEVEKFINTLPFTKGLDDGQYNDGVIYGAIIGIDWMRNKIQEGKR
jgi:hypothetical protein